MGSNRMFFDSDIKGSELPPKILCLTYDDGPGQTIADGPGPRTLELGRYLFLQNIQATFFMVGKSAEEYPDILPQLHAWGHLIGNHTYSHPGLVALAEAGGDVIGEIARTDVLIRPYASAPPVFFRPPYGNWRQKQPPDNRDDKPRSLVADILNRSGMFTDYVGPVNWDISAADYDFWRRGATAQECAAAYLQKIEQLGKGIILMHDSSEDEAVRLNNRTLEMTKIIVPVLKEKGFHFVRLDRVPQVMAAMREKSVVPGP
jgi:peptidoglycan/xylan/chitin deacetylase (PgdA/CDA1 family)